MILNCDNCEGVQAELCRATFDAFEEVFVRSVDDAKNLDPFELAQQVEILGKFLIGNIDSALEQAESVAVTDEQKRHNAIIEKLVGDVSDIGCSLGPVEIATKGFLGALQRKIVQESFDGIDTTGQAEPLVTPKRPVRPEYLTQLTPRERLPVADSTEIIRERRSREQGRQEELAKARSSALASYVAAQGWDPENLNFSQKLDLKMHLRSLGYRD